MALGINVKLFFTVTFVIGAAFGALGGAVTAPKVSVVPGLGVEVIVLAFAVVVIGGLGSIGGALLASLILGVGVSLIQLPLSRAAIVFPYFAMALILIIRPWGLFGKPER